MYKQKILKILIQGKVNAKENEENQTFLINVDNHSLKEGSTSLRNNEFTGPCFISKSVMVNGVDRDASSYGQTTVLLVLSDKRVSKRVGISLANIRK